MLHDWFSAWYPPTRQVHNPGYPATRLPDWYASWPLKNWVSAWYPPTKQVCYPQISSLPHKNTLKILTQFPLPRCFFLCSVPSLFQYLVLSTVQHAHNLKTNSVHTTKLHWYTTVNKPVHKWYLLHVVPCTSSAYTTQRLPCTYQATTLIFFLTTTFLDFHSQQPCKNSLHKMP